MFHKGFTLIEVLVTISIIALIATIGLQSYNNASKQGRDSRRIGDVQAYAQALEQAYSATGSYPTSAGVNNQCARIASLQTYFAGPMPANYQGASSAQGYRYLCYTGAAHTSGFGSFCVMANDIEREENANCTTGSVPTSPGSFSSNPLGYCKYGQQ